MSLLKGFEFPLWPRGWRGFFRLYDYNPHRMQVPSLFLPERGRPKAVQPGIAGLFSLCKADALASSSILETTSPGFKWVYLRRVAQD